jgi:hypothetical protein
MEISGYSGKQGILAKVRTLLADGGKLATTAFSSLEHR